MSQSFVFGWHTVDAITREEPQRLKKVWIQKGRRDRRVGDVIRRLDDLGVSWEQVHRRELDQRVNGVHQGVVAAVAEARALQENDLMDLIERTEAPLLLVLDGVTDPHNLGACLRTAEAAGVLAVVAPKDKSAPLNATARKVSSGAAETLPLVKVTNLARCLRRLQDAGLWVIGSAGEAGATLHQADFRGGVALVMGAEGKGMRRLTREHCDQLIRIPMAGAVESLNVSVATGVCLFEAVRQRGEAP
ncbi:23S rRNA (guanosine(2251)-2'-O)-methyltransferase RlmB [Tamilnaduibacter salinus]|uniref:23S rRNA (guanosine-2'-O-)-methyltransferase RlmB n=1 Tax=Tamilnaduibacter salinus TaxID=1484056 RepID=A0A2A2I6R2_9GAMM|nr:23S rRNA (guanosine(2251)-2'-O)-methyltransferase RlmB [Tamilnaduibacter salinus]PAV27282.1 23S rRNA (guanosine(2251)-2'-O)-methyltransferase RlmB [Tamilnaduibacter salinus]